MTDANQNREEQYLKIFVFKKYYEPILSDDILCDSFHTILFIISGSLDIYVNNTLKTFSSLDLILIPNGVSFKIPKSDTNSKLYIISFSPELLLNNSISDFNIRFLFLSAQNLIVIPINSEDIPFLKQMFKLIYAIQKTNNHQLQKELLDIGVHFLIQKRMDSNHINITKNSQKQKIILRFFKSLKQNYKKEHRVRFYADSLCITAGYLNKIAKELTDKTVKQLIEEIIITESKIMLQNNMLTISEIAEELHFSSCSSFSSFFKKHTSFSPSDYRFRSPR